MRVGWHSGGWNWRTPSAEVTVSLRCCTSKCWFISWKIHCVLYTIQLHAKVYFSMLTHWRTANTGTNLILTGKLATLVPIWYSLAKLATLVPIWYWLANWQHGYQFGTHWQTGNTGTKLVLTGELATQVPIWYSLANWQRWYQFGTHCRTGNTDTNLVLTGELASLVPIWYSLANWQHC